MAGVGEIGMLDGALNDGVVWVRVLLLLEVTASLVNADKYLPSPYGSHV